MKIQTVYKDSAWFDPVDFSPEYQPLTEIRDLRPTFPENNRYLAHDEISAVCLYQIIGPCLEIGEWWKGLQNLSDDERDQKMRDFFKPHTKNLGNFRVRLAEAIQDDSDYWRHTDDYCDISIGDSFSPESWITIQNGTSRKSYAVPFLQIIGETENVRHILRMALVCMNVDPVEIPHTFETFSRHQMARGENNTYQSLHDDNLFYNCVRRRVWDLFHYDRTGKIRDHSVGTNQNIFWGGSSCEEFVNDEGVSVVKKEIFQFAMVWNSMKLDYQESEYPLRVQRFLDELAVDPIHAELASYLYLDETDRKIFQQITSAVSQINLRQMSEDFESSKCRVSIPVNLQIDIPVEDGLVDLQYAFSLLSFSDGNIRMLDQDRYANHICSRIDFQKSVWLEDGLTIGVTPNVD